MDLESFQLQKGNRKIPKLLLEYSYFLDNSNSKQILIGYDSFSFKPYIVFLSLSKRQFIHITPDNWKFVVACLADSCDYLNKLTDKFELRQSGDAILHIYAYNNDFNTEDRYICVHDILYNVKIYLAREELDVLLKLSCFLSLMINHFDERWGYIKEFYRGYLFKCFARGVNYLNETQYFQIQTRYANYLRLFHEIPVLCADKLKSDLQELHNGNI